MALLTSTDVVAINSTEAALALVDDAKQVNPEIGIIAASPVSKTTYKTLKRTANPTAGFRADNTGVAGTKSTYTAVSTTCYYLDSSWETDRKIAHGIDQGKEFLFAAEASGAMNSAMTAVCSQLYYGTDADASGFAGLQASVASDMVVSGGGTTADVQTSVYAIRTNQVDGVNFAWGNDGEIEMGDVNEQRLTDGSGNPFDGYRQSIAGYVGLSVVSGDAIGRICNLNAKTDSKGLTDDLLSELIAKFPVGKKPDYLLMNRDSLVALQKSRTATNSDGTPAPFPTEAFGVPIVVTDSIVSTEAVKTV